MKSLMFVTAAASTLALALPAAAQGWSVSTPEHTGAYGELGYTGTSIHGADQSIIDGRLGWRFNRFIGAEGELGVGVSGGARTFGADTTTPVGVGLKQRYNAAGYVVGYLPLTPRADLFARVGYGAAQYRLDPAGLAQYDAHTNGFRFGGGAQFFVDGQNGIRAQYTRYDIQNLSDAGGYFGGDRSTNEWSVALSHRF